MAEKLQPIGALKTMLSRVRYGTKLLAMLGVMAVLVGILAWEENNCGAERVVVLAAYPLQIFEKTSVAEVEKNHITTINLDGKQTTLPFGFINARWEELKRHYEMGDCFFHYQMDCGTLCRSEGYVLIRNGKAVYFIQTRVS